MGIFNTLFGWIGKEDQEADPFAIDEPINDIPIPAEVIEESVAESAPPSPDDGYWWESPAPMPEKAVEFEEVDTDAIYQKIADRLLNKEITMVDIPDNVMHTMQLLDQEEFDYAEVTEQIEKSPGLLGEFLKAANSAQFNRGKKITNIRVILPRLGRSNVKGILYLSSSKMALPGHELFKVVASEIVEHSMVVGRIAEYLSQNYYTDPNKAFLAGLVHDVGKMAIIKELGETTALPSDIDISFSETLFNNIFPNLHVEAGELIGSYWQLDGEILQAIRHHHASSYTDEKDAMLLPALINFSDSCARLLGFGRPMEAVDIFSLPSAKALYIEDNPATRAFLQGLMELFEDVERDDSA
ncbi:hypothetical protein BVX99_02215 [bacterium F16]|nr:hypothetical protein BVX99_02215 [bacterium F16]